MLPAPGAWRAASLSRSCGAISALYQEAKLMNADTWGKPSPMALRAGGWDVNKGVLSILPLRVKE